MNKARRTKLSSIYTALERVYDDLEEMCGDKIELTTEKEVSEFRATITKFLKYLDDEQAKLAGVLDEEEWAFGNMPENLQGSMRGCESEEAIDAMYEASDGIEECVGKLKEVLIATEDVKKIENEKVKEIIQEVDELMENVTDRLSEIDFY